MEVLVAFFASNSSLVGLCCPEWDVWFGVPPLYLTTSIGASPAIRVRLVIDSFGYTDFGSVWCRLAVTVVFLVAVLLASGSFGKCLRWSGVINVCSRYRIHVLVIVGGPWCGDGVRPALPVVGVPACTPEVASV